MKEKKLSVWNPLYIYRQLKMHEIIRNYRLNIGRLMSGDFRLIFRVVFSPRKSCPNQCNPGQPIHAKQRCERRPPLFQSHPTSGHGKWTFYFLLVLGPVGSVSYLNFSVYGSRFTSSEMRDNLQMRSMDSNGDKLFINRKYRSFTVSLGRCLLLHVVVTSIVFVCSLMQHTPFTHSIN